MITNMIVNNSNEINVIFNVRVCIFIAFNSIKQHFNMHFNTLNENAFQNFIIF